MDRPFIVRPALIGDLPGVLKVQHQAFGRVASTLHIDPADLPPLRENLAELEHLFQQGTRFFVATASDGAIVGSVRGVETHGIVEVGRLVVADGWLRCGVATQLMVQLEAAYPEAVSFVLFTGEQAQEPLALYQKLGYTLSRREDLGPIVLVWLEKPGRAARQ